MVPVHWGKCRIPRNGSAKRRHLQDRPVDSARAGHRLHRPVPARWPSPSNEIYGAVHQQSFRIEFSARAERPIIPQKKMDDHYSHSIFAELEKLAASAYILTAPGIRRFVVGAHYFKRIPSFVVAAVVSHILASQFLFRYPGSGGGLMDAIAELRRQLWTSPRVDFENWFVEFWWDAESSVDEGTAKIFHRIEGLIAEASHAGWTDAELREELDNASRHFAQSARLISAQRPFAMSAPHEAWENFSISRKPAGTAIEAVPSLSSAAGEPITCRA